MSITQPTFAMSSYHRLVFPLLRRLDAESAHEHTLSALERAQSSDAGRALLRRIAGDLPAQPVELAGLRFPNPLGMAAGYDKDARVVEGLALLGFGHVEVGTLTPRPQAGNPRPRIFRLVPEEGLINRMGFPNGGVAAALPRLQALAERQLDVVVGVSLGKQKETPLEEAALDYVAVMTAVFPYADYLALNISSPNTPGLRDLQGGRYLEQLLLSVTVERDVLSDEYDRPPPPLFVKIAPDLEWDDIDDILAAAQGAGVEGLIATNTTLSRYGVQARWETEAGGLSGRPLADRSTEIVRYIVRQTGGSLPVIGVGGIASAAGARAKLDAGAALVQLYTGLVYGGPALPGQILRGLPAGPAQPA